MNDKHDDDIFSGCRLYVCRSVFGEPPLCKKYNSYDAYYRDLNAKKLDNTQFIPVCGYPTGKIFDMIRLSIANSKLPGVRLDTAKKQRIDPVDASAVLLISTGCLLAAKSHTKAEKTVGLAMISAGVLGGFYIHN